MHMEKRVYCCSLKMEILVLAATPALPEVKCEIATSITVCLNGNSQISQEDYTRNSVIFLMYWDNKKMRRLFLAKPSTYMSAFFVCDVWEIISESN